jgi:predicted ABC-type transport system involved in lysophospholipase L1 biosynthesis ATPase subunit
VTLLHLLAGLDLPTAGEVYVLDEPMSELDATRRALVRRAHVGVVSQGTDLVPFLTALETVELALSLRGLRPRAAATLAAVGLESSRSSAQRDGDFSALKWRAGDDPPSTSSDD